MSDAPAAPSRIPRPMRVRASNRADKQAKFLAEFANCGIITVAAKVAGIDRKTVHNWLEKDERFSLAYHQAEKQAEEVLEAAAWKRSVQGVAKQRHVYDRGGKLIDTEITTDYSDSLLMFLLRARNPTKYRENKFSFEHGGADGGPIRMETKVSEPFDYDAYRRLFESGGVVAAPAGTDGPDQPLDTPLSDA